ncbi:MAG: OmpA family protein, partial [Prevotella sp.]|nr:OmpA family protein [Prevotella sp.]
MKSIKIIAIVLGMCVCLSGCKTWNGMSKTGQGAIIGTGGGAALGSIIGALAGNTAVGAVIGGAVGAGAGAVIGNR